MTRIAPFARRFKNQLQRAPLGDELVNAQQVEAACAAAGHRWRRCFWTPTVTILTLLRQVLHSNCSCRQAVALTLAASAAPEETEEDEAVSGDPSAYSQARQKLPRQVLEALNERTVQAVQRQAAPSRLWCGRRVVIVDGSTVSMPDAAELQKTFPQPSGQKPGCGFPMMRLLVIFCWASGSLLELVAESLHVSELPMFRRLLSRLMPGTVVLGDAHFGSYYDLVLLRRHDLGRGLSPASASPEGFSMRDPIGTQRSRDHLEQACDASPGRIAGRLGRRAGDADRPACAA